jgi:hypothetical protein
MMKEVEKHVRDNKGQTPCLRSDGQIIEREA